MKEIDDKLYIELTSEVAWALLQSTSPASYDHAQILTSNNLGTLQGFPNEKWVWRPSLRESLPEFIYGVYLGCKYEMR